MKVDRVEAMVATALAVAGEADGYLDRELGPIHLLKYLYLGDLVFAEEHAGATYSGTPWRFHKFGPWSAELYEQLPRAASIAGATTRHFTSPRTDGDAVRWRLHEAGDVGNLQSSLPPSVACAIGRYVKKFHNDTSSLLHFVYRTAPMLKAAPGEMLSFQVKHEETEEDVAVSRLEIRDISRAQLKKLKERVQARLAAQRAIDDALSPGVTYDQDYFEILDLLDRDAGPAVKMEEGTLEFSPDVWTSEAMRGSEIP